MPTAPKAYRPPHAGTARQQEKSWQSRRDGRHEMYNLWAWRGPKGLRKRRLAEEPLCRECLKNGAWLDVVDEATGEVMRVFVPVLTAATEVDHIEPHKGDIEKFLEWDNTASLCKSCHSRKTMSEQR